MACDSIRFPSALVYSGGTVSLWSEHTAVEVRCGGAGEGVVLSAAVLHNSEATNANLIYCVEQSPTCLH